MKALIGIFYKDYNTALKHLKNGYEILPCSNGFLIIKSNHLSNDKKGVEET